MRLDFSTVAITTTTVTMLRVFSSAAFSFVPCGVSGFRSTAISQIKPGTSTTATRLFSSTLLANGNAATSNSNSGIVNDSNSSTETTTQYETRSTPAPGNPFHYAFPVHSLEEAKRFYGTVLGCEEGRSSGKWQDYSLYGHQIVCHWAGDDYRCIDYYNPVDGDEVPVPHAGLALETVKQFEDLADRLRSHGIEFVIEPHLRFKGEPGEQHTMFFKDPSGNNLEFKAMTNHSNLFAKYNVPAE